MKLICLQKVKFRQLLNPIIIVLLLLLELGFHFKTIFKVNVNLKNIFQIQL